MQFGIFQVNRRTAELFRQGVRLKVQDQPMQVLLMLLAKPGEIVTREEIRQQLWPADTFVEFDHSVNTAIKKLRQALKDDAESPRFIETIPRKGYRFIAPVSAGNNVSSVAVMPIEVEPIPPERKAFNWRLAGIAGGALLIGVLVLAGFWVMQRSRSGSAIQIEPFTTYPGFQDHPSLSPDGLRVAFMWSRADALGHPIPPHIYVKQVGTEDPVQLTKGDDMEVSPVWSPDGNQIAFVRFPQEIQANTRCGVYVASALGGVERLLATVDCESDFNPAGFGSMLSWSPDGKTLALLEKASSGITSIYLLDVNTLQMQQLTHPVSPTLGDSSPSFSPDGSEVAFIRNGKEVSDVWVVSAKGGEPTRLSNLNQIFTPGVAWAPDGKSLIFGGFALYRVSCSGGDVEVLSSSGYFGSPNIRGNRLVMSQYTWDKRIWDFALNERGIAPNPPKVVLASTREQDGASFSPDGKRIVFQSMRTGFYEIWRSDADGSNLLQLTNFRGTLAGTPSFSPDGTTVIFDSRVTGHAHIFTVSAEGGPLRQVTNGNSDEVMPKYSRDGRWIYFGSNRSGSWNIWKVPTSGGDAVQVTKTGGFNGYESEDGKFFYYARGTAIAGIWRVPVDGGPEEQVVPRPTAGLNGHWTIYHGTIYYADAGSNDLASLPMTLHSYDLA
ncbi:MAG TPA: winged helix-turn-helix domain-containing protein, partial [Terriglobales bacterium]